MAARNITLEENDKAERGTDIVLHIKDDSAEFLDDRRIRGILEKFCRFLPIPVFFEEKQINNTHPAWTRKPSELTTRGLPEFL